MPLNISAPETTELKPRILVFGVGGAGGNAVNNMIDANLEGVDFVVANTDAQALHRSRTEKRVQMGAQITEGLGAGARPEVGQQSAEDSLAEIMEHLQGAHMVFITAGMGGGTGTGGAPVIARAAREQGILTVGVVTKPFHFEGTRRMRIAESGIEQLQSHVDTLIVIPNQNLFRIATEKTTFADAFSMADQVLHSGVRGITDLMVMPGLINLDFADVRTVMNEMGKAMMGTGEGTGEKRAVEAAHAAIANPLLDDVSMKGARGVLINITGGMDMTLYEVDEAANEIRNEVDPDANIIVGSTFDENLEGVIRVSVVATGIDAETLEQADPRAKSAGGQVVSAWRSDKAKPQSAAQPARPEPMVRRLMDSETEESAAERRREPADGGIHAKAAAYRAEQERRESGLDEPRETSGAVDDEVARPDAFTRADAQTEAQADHAEPADRPEVVRHQERLAREAETFHRAAPRAEASRDDEAHEEDEGGMIKRGLSLFGRRSRPAASQARTTPPQAPARSAAHAQPAARPRPAPSPSPSADLFGEEFDESELEIPAFLRRQAN